MPTYNLVGDFQQKKRDGIWSPVDMEETLKLFMLCTVYLWQKRGHGPPTLLSLNLPCTFSVDCCQIKEWLHEGTETRSDK